jgi:hypothetical protein
LARTTMRRSMGGRASSSLALGCLVAEAAALARGSGSARRGRITAGCSGVRLGCLAAALARGWWPSLANQERRSTLLLPRINDDER